MSNINRRVLEQIIVFHRTRLAQYEAIEANCLSCENFQQNDRQCLKWSTPVPEDVVSKGCDEWVYSEIPF